MKTLVRKVRALAPVVKDLRLSLKGTGAAVKSVGDSVFARCYDRWGMC